jgi:hypothetical protein
VIDRDVANSCSIENGCRYYTPGTGAPDCIVGHVLHYLGASSAPEGQGASTVLSLLHAIDPALDEVETAHIGRILDEAQGAQDEGKTWGEALALAQSRYKSLQPTG